MQDIFTGTKGHVEGECREEHSYRCLLCSCLNAIEAKETDDTLYEHLISNSAVVACGNRLWCGWMNHGTGARRLLLVWPFL